MTATFHLSQSQVFPAGTTVGAYLRTAWPRPSSSVGPSGSAVATAVVADDTVGDATFSGLAYATRYYAAAQVSGSWRWVAFQTAAVNDPDVLQGEIDDLSVLAASNTTAIAALSPPVGPRLMAKLKNNAADAVVCILADSTTVDGTPEGSPTTAWATRLAAWLATQFPTHTVKRYTWTDDGAFLGSWSAATTVQTGSGAQTLHVYNGGVGGKRATYPLGQRLKPMVQDIQPDLTFISFGHNDSTEVVRFPWTYQSLVESVLWVAPQTELALIAQNPQTANTYQQQRADLVAQVAKVKGCAFVNVCQAFVDTGAVASYLNADGVHPNSTGVTLTLGVLQAALTAGGTVRQPPKLESGFGKAGPDLLVNGDFSAWGTGPTGWTLTNCTASQDTTNFERARLGYACKLSIVGSQSYGAYMAQSLPISRVKGRWVTVAARIYVPSGQTGDVNIGRIALYDNGTGASANTCVAIADQQCRDGFYWVVVSRRIAADATTAEVDVYVTNSTTASGNITIDRVTAVLGPEPRERLGVETVEFTATVPTLAWSDCTLASGVSVVSGYQSTVQAAQDANFIYLRGCVVTTGIAAGAGVLTLPAGIAPGTKRRVGVSASGDHGVEMVVNTDRTVVTGATAWPNTKEVGLDGRAIPR